MVAIKAHELEDDSEELYVHRTIVVDRGQALVRIDKFLQDRLEAVSRNRIQNAIKAGCILVDDKVVKSNYKVKPNETIQLVLPSNPDEDTAPQAEDIPLRIVYEDEEVLVIDKEPGMVVHPGVGNADGTLVNALLGYYQKRAKDLPVMQGNDHSRAGLVHRIDKETSGLLVIAKTEYAMTYLAKQFFDHTIDRTYIALVWGSPPEPSGTIETQIGRDARDRLLMTVTDEDSGKRAVTHYEVLEDLYYVSLVKCRLETGRTHQIRVHMKHLGCPLFNDERYGGNRIIKGTVFSKYKQFVQNNFQACPRQALHAASLGFVHPGTGQRVYLESELPEDMTTVLNNWRNYLKSRKELM